MKAFEQIMRILERGISGAVALVAIAFLAMAFISTSQLPSNAVEQPEGPIALVRPMSDPTMVKAYRALQKSGKIKNPKDKLTDTDRFRLNQTYRGMVKFKADRARQSTFSSSSDDYYDGPSDGWGN